MLHGMLQWHVAMAWCMACHNGMLRWHVVRHVMFTLAGTLPDMLHGTLPSMLHIMLDGMQHVRWLLLHRLTGSKPAEESTAAEAPSARQG